MRIRKGNLSKTSTPILRENPKIRSKKAMSTSTTQLLHSYIIQWISSPKATKHNYVKLILEIQVLGSSENISYVVEHPKKKMSNQKSTSPKNISIPPIPRHLHLHCQTLLSKTFPATHLYEELHCFRGRLRWALLCLHGFFPGDQKRNLGLMGKRHTLR